MTSVVGYFSEGAGLYVFMAGLLAVLTGVGIAVRMSKMRCYFGEILLPCTLIALALLFYVMTFSFPVEDVGPASIPRLWIFWIIVFCCVILWQLFLHKNGKKESKNTRLGFMLTIMFIVIAYFFAMQLIGYFISSFVFLMVLMHIMSYRKYFVMLSVSTGWMLFSYFIIYKLLYIQLPMGFWENYM